MRFLDIPICNLRPFILYFCNKINLTGNPKVEHMKKKVQPTKSQAQTSNTQKGVRQISKPNNQSQKPSKPKNFDKSAFSNPQMHLKSSYLVNDNLVNTLNPKRTSMDLTAFIQVFRKKMRQTTIAREFEHSLQKFKSLTQNKARSYTRQKGGFVGSYKKQSQLLVQNNKTDNKLKKIIISDLQFKDRKSKSKANYSQVSLMEKQSVHQNSEVFTGERSKLSRRRILTHSQTQHNDEMQNKTISFSIAMLDQQKAKENPQNGKLVTDYTPTLYHESQKVVQQDLKKASSIFTNRRLETIASYQRPNLMYNLSLYRKKQSYNVLRNSKKRESHPLTFQQ